MKAFFALFFLLATSPAHVLACSLSLSKPFTPDAANSAEEPPVPAQLKSVDLVPNIGDGEGDSCSGVGFIVVTLTGKQFLHLKKQGFFVRPVAGVRDPGLFPSHALAPHVIRRRTLTLTWGWVSLTPDEDGHVRWRFEVIPVSASGVRGEPIEVCVATDSSCPPPQGAQLRPNISFKPTAQSPRDWSAA